MGAGCALVEMDSTWFEEREYQEEAMAGQSIAQRRMLPGQENENPAVLFHEATGHPSKELMKLVRPGSVEQRGGGGAFQDFRKEVENAKKDGQLKSTEGVGGVFEKIKWDTEAEAVAKFEDV